MGCDIHTMVEYEADRYVSTPPEGGSSFVPSGKWKAIRDEVFEYPYFNEKMPVSRWNKRFTKEPMGGRNYNVFSLLADVRNERSTHNIFDPTMKYAERDAITPLDNPRGVPENASKHWKRYVEKWGVDLHSTSYFTLQELIDFEAMGAFDQTIVQRGYVDLEQYLAHKNEGKNIESWCAWTSAPSMTEDEWLALTDEQRQEHIDKLAEGGSWGAPHIVYKWLWPLRESLDGLLKAMDEMKANAPRELNPAMRGMSWQEAREFEKTNPRLVYDYTRIRIVFGFDN